MSDADDQTQSSNILLRSSRKKHRKQRADNYFKITQASFSQRRDTAFGLKGSPGTQRNEWKRPTSRHATGNERDEAAPKASTDHSLLGVNVDAGVPDSGFGHISPGAKETRWALALALL